MRGRKPCNALALRRVSAKLGSCVMYASASTVIKFDHHFCMQKYSYMDRPRGKPQEQINVAVDALTRLVPGECTCACRVKWHACMSQHLLAVASVRASLRASSQVACRPFSACLAVQEVPCTGQFPLFQESAHRQSFYSHVDLPKNNADSYGWSRQMNATTVPKIVS